ncbi:hypothetical protein ACN3E9_00670 [Vibrio pectenicida]|uniref:hypothetical protein n=1 Tax=Vibrio pectenicida TaxID=62763 RepID=UPI003B99F122
MENIRQASPLMRKRAGLVQINRETTVPIHSRLKQEIEECVENASDFDLNHTSLSVSSLVNGHLRQSMPTPLYFQKEKIYRDIIKLKVDALSSSTGQDKKLILLEINAAKNDLRTIKRDNERKVNNDSYILAYAWEVFHDISNTDSHLFTNIDIDKLFFSDLIYSYSDSNSRTQQGAIAIVDYLCHKATNHPITSRQNVRLSWPEEIEPQRAYALESFLKEESENIFGHLEETRLLEKVERKRKKVSRSIETPKAYFQKTLDKLLSKHPGHSIVKLTDTVRYKNSVISMDNMNFQAAANYDNPPVSMAFSVADILAGRVREWESTNISYGSPELSNLGAISTALLNDLKDEDIQPQYISSIHNLRSDITVEKDFYSYVRSVLRLHGVTRTGSYPIGQAPLLLVCPNPSGGPNLPADSSQYLSEEHDPIKVISLQTSNAFTFSSCNDFRQKIRHNEELKKWVALHCPAEFSDDYSNLNIGRSKTVYSGLYERTIDQYANDMDVWVRSASEAGALKAFEIIEMLTPVLVLPAFAMTPVAGFVYGAAVAATPHLGRAAVSDTDEERDKHLKSAAIAVAIEATFQLGFKAAAKAAGRVFRPSAKVATSTTNATARSFKIQKHKYFGRVQNGRFEVSYNDGRTWNKGGKVAEFAWRMQNAGPGARRLPLPEPAGQPPVAPPRPPETLVRPTVPPRPPTVVPRPPETLGKPPVVPRRPVAGSKNVLRELEEPPVGAAREVEVFNNKQPDSYAKEVKRALTHAQGPYDVRNEQGFKDLINSNEDFKWVLKSDKNIVIGRELSHAVLGEGTNVISAGHAKKIADGKIWLSNQTGHYQVNYESIKQSVRYWKELGYTPYVDGHSEIINNGYLNIFA